MANYGERIAYWYLRLNGFFLVENFVHHRNRHRQPSDSDLLAIRLRHSSSLIDGGPGQFALDHLWHDRFCVNLTTSNVAVIVQVKAGHGGGDSARAFERSRLTDAVRFIGQWNAQEVPPIVDALRRGPDLEVDDWTVVKLLIGMTQLDTAHFLSLADEATTFVRHRMQYARKRSDWVYFPDDLIQYLIWHPPL